MDEEREAMLLRDAEMLGDLLFDLSSIITTLCPSIWLSEYGQETKVKIDAARSAFENAESPSIAILGVRIKFHASPTLMESVASLKSEMETFRNENQQLLVTLREGRAE